MKSSAKLGPSDPRWKLVQRYTDNLASGDEVEELERELIQDHDFRAAFLFYLSVDSSLEEALAGTEPFVGGENKVPLFIRRFLPVAAAIAIGLFAISIFNDAKRTVRVEILKSGTEEFQAGQSLRLNEFGLDSGTVQFRLDSGVVIDAQGPAQFAFIDPMNMQVTRGQCTAEVNDDAKGFTIVTATAHIVDLGTRFRVGILESGETDVAVIEGEVEVYKPRLNPHETQPLATLTEGDGMRVSADRHGRLWTLVLNRDGDGIAPLSESATVSAVTDNVVDPEFRNYYGLVPGGMSDGARAYTAKPTVRWKASDDSGFPAELKGADAIRTFSYDRKDRGLQIKLSLKTPASIYVMLDTRGPAPDWLVEKFHDTGLRLKSGPWKVIPIVRDIDPDTDGNLFLNYSVWRMDTVGGTTIELGAPHAVGQASNRAMYGIAVKPLNQ